MVGTAKKKLGVFVFVEAQEINLRDSLQGSKCDAYFIFLWELFSLIMKKFLPLITLEFFLEIFLPQPVVIFLTDFHQSIMGSFTKKVCKFAEKNTRKIFSWSYRRNRTLSAKRLYQTPFFRFQIRASLVIESFLLKLKTITSCFEHDTFHNNLREKSMDKSILANISGCYQNRAPSQTFLWGCFHLQKFQEIVPSGATF